MPVKVNRLVVCDDEGVEYCRFTFSEHEMALVVSTVGSTEIALRPFNIGLVPVTIGMARDVEIAFNGPISNTADLVDTGFEDYDEIYAVNGFTVGEHIEVKLLKAAENPGWIYGNNDVVEIASKSADVGIILISENSNNEPIRVQGSVKYHPFLGA